MAGVGLQDVGECEAKDRANGKDQLDPGNGGCTDSWLREAGTGGGRSFGGGARGEGGAEHGYVPVRWWEHSGR